MSQSSWRAEVKSEPPLAAPRAAEARAPERWVWHLRTRLPESHAQPCDLVSTPSGLVIAASSEVFEKDGAALFRLQQDGSLARLFEWDGQGFLRVLAFGNRLLVPDGDPPFSALSFVFSWDVDGYVFVSDAEGRFDEDWREVLPASYHVFDVAVLPGGLAVASTGAYPEADTAYLSKRAPAVLYGDAGPDKPWRRLVEYPSRDSVGVSRFTWLLSRPGGALLAGLQTSRADLPMAVRIEGLPDAPHVVEVTGLPGAPIRWVAWRDRVFALTYHETRTLLGSGMRRATLHVSLDDGRTFTPVADAPEQPEALVALDGDLYLLAGGALHRSTDGERFTRVSEPLVALAEAPGLLVSHALVAHGGSLWSANPRTGELFEAVPAP